MKNSLLSLFICLFTAFPALAQKSNIDGTYTMKDGVNSATIAVELDENSNTVKIQGDAIWVGNSTEGQVNLGEIAGVFPLNGNTIHYYELLEDEPDEYCKLTLTFGNKSLIVTNDNSQCGGMNVSFNGKYKRTGAVHKKWPIFEEKFSTILAPISGELGQFWAVLQKVIVAKNATQIAQLTRFPFIIGNGKSADSKEVFVQSFNDMFPDFVIKSFKQNAKPALYSRYNTKSALSAVSLKDIEYIDELGDNYESIIDKGSLVYRFYGGTQSQKFGGYEYNYYFAKIKGKFMLFFAERIELS